MEKVVNTNMLRPLKLEGPNGGVKSTHPDPAMCIDGNPSRTSTPLLSTGMQLIRASEWTSEVGSWRFERPTDNVEIFHMISGQCRVTALDDEGITFDAGDIGLLPAGFKGTFIVLKEVRKIAFIVPPTDEYVKLVTG